MLPEKILKLKIKKAKKQKKQLYLIGKLGENPDEWIKDNKLNEKDIEKMLKQADRAYHNGESVIDDVHHDVIVAHPEELTGKEKQLEQKVAKGLLKTASIHMGSMDKVKPDTAKTSKKLVEKYNGPHVISDKLMNFSIMVHYKPTIQFLVFTQEVMKKLVQMLVI